MSYGSKIRINNTDYSIASSLYGTCSTGSNTAAKVVTCADFDTLITGVLILVKFDNGNTAANPTLNVNSTGAKAIYLDSNNAPGTTELKSWRANEVVPFVYDGTYWMMAADRKAVQDAITTNASDISTINGKIGSTALPTTAQTITGAIAEHETDISGLSTTITNLTGTASPKMDGTAAVGTATKYAREDHVHPTDTSRAAASAVVPGTATPKMDGTAAVGTATKYAREDHVHPVDTSRAAQSSLNTTNTNVSNLTTTVNGKETKKLIFTSKAASSWTNNGSTNFPKRCAIACTGVTAAMTALVFFAAAQAESGNYSPYAETYAGGVYIYSTQTTSITVPKILVFAGS